VADYAGPGGVAVELPFADYVVERPGDEEAHPRAGGGRAGEQAEIVLPGIPEHWRLVRPGADIPADRIVSGNGLLEFLQRAHRFIVLVQPEWAGLPDEDVPAHGGIVQPLPRN